MTDTLERERTGRHGGEPHSLIELIKELRDETMLLLRQEVLLARREVEEKVAHVKRTTITMAAGAVMALAGVLFLLLAASNGLGEALVEADVAAGVAVWLAPLIVGLIVCIGGAIMAWAARRSLQETTIAPERTLRSLEENRRWAKQKVNEL